MEIVHSSFSAFQKAHVEVPSEKTFNATGPRAPLIASCLSGLPGLNAAHLVDQAFQNVHEQFQCLPSMVEGIAMRKHIKRNIAPAISVPLIVNGQIGKTGFHAPLPVPMEPAAECAW